MEKHSIPGIIGGVGPEATASFYLKILEAAKRRHMGLRPAVLMASVALPLETEKAFLDGDKNTEPVYIQAIAKAVKALELSGADFLAVPSNTVCLLLESIKDTTRLEILDPINATILEIQRREMKSVEVLGTSSLVASNVYGKRLQDQGIRVTYPAPQRQEEVERIINRLVESSHGDQELQSLEALIDESLSTKTQGVVVGCTDLHLVFEQRPPHPRVVDSLETLAETVARRLAGPFQ